MFAKSLSLSHFSVRKKTRIARKKLEQRFLALFLVNSRNKYNVATLNLKLSVSTISNLLSCHFRDGRNVVNVNFFIFCENVCLHDDFYSFPRKLARHRARYIKFGNGSVLNVDLYTKRR